MKTRYPIFAATDTLRVEGDAYVEELRPLKGVRRWYVTWPFEVSDGFFKPVSHGVLDAMVEAASPADAAQVAYDTQFSTDVVAMLMFLGA